MAVKGKDKSMRCSLTKGKLHTIYQPKISHVGVSLGNDPQSSMASVSGYLVSRELRKSKASHEHFVRIYYNFFYSKKSGNNVNMFRTLADLKMSKKTKNKITCLRSLSLVV